MRNFLISFVALFSVVGFAQSAPVLEPQDFMAQVMEFVKGWGGFTTLFKISGIIALVVSSMKVSFLKELLWDKLGAFKVWVAPVLGLIAGVLGLGAGGAELSAAVVFAYLTAGGGAIILHELLDSVKAIPGIGPVWVSFIGIVQGLLGGKKSV